jgi:hypothetical protein
MRYKAPQIKQLQSLADELRLSYKKSKGENPQRLSFITLYDRLVKHMSLDLPEKMTKVLIGALVFEMEIIEKEYKGSSAGVSKGWVYNSGSQLYTDIVRLLGVTPENQLSDDERMIHLFKFYEYVQKILPDSCVDQLIWKSKIGLQDAVKAQLKRVKQREFKKIDALVHGTPNLTAIRKNVGKIYVDYQKAVSSRWFQNKKRTSLLVFIDFIDQTCRDLYDKDFSGKETTEQEKDINYMQAFNTRMGLIMFVLTNISNEYAVLSPERSILFQRCLKTVNAKHLSRIEYESKITWLRALSTHLSNIKSLKDYYQKTLKTWEPQGLVNIENIHSLIETELTILDAEKNRPSRSVEYLGTATSYAAQYGLAFAATKYAANMALFAIPRLATIAATAAMGPVGLVVYGAAGTIITTQIGRLVKDHLVPVAVAGLYAKILEKIGDAIGGATANVVVSAFSVSAKGISHLIGLYRQKSHDDFIQEWIDTLLGMPSDLISDAQKDQIRSVLGIDDAPVPISVTEIEESVPEQKVAI